MGLGYVNTENQKPTAPTGGAKIVQGGVMLVLLVVVTWFPIGGEIQPSCYLKRKSPDVEGETHKENIIPPFKISDIHCNNNNKKFIYIYICIKKYTWLVVKMLVPEFGPVTPFTLGPAL